MMNKSKHTIKELQELQALPLSLKIRLTKQRIREWVGHFGEDGVYVSFSGGKDSTVLLHIVREMYPDVPAVFVDTGLEYPEIRQFVRTFDNVTWLKPKKNFRQVIEDYGYPFISKEVSECVQGARKYLTEILAENSVDRQTDRQTDSTRIRISTGELLERANTQSLLRLSRGGQTTSTENLQELANILNDRMVNKKGGANQRLAIMLGMLTRDKEHPVQANIPSKDRSMYSQVKYKFMLEAPFEISNKCCNVMKKEPAHRYHKETGRVPMTAQTASESRLRTQKWLQNGCNGFDLKIPISNPMSFWVEQDVLLYIYQNHLPIASVYGEVVKDTEVEGQYDFEDLGIFDLGRPTLKTTGCDRTGCMFCGFGCHLEPEGEGRFQRLKITHPKIYDYIMRPWEEGGLNYKEVIDWMNKHGNLNIEY